MHFEGWGLGVAEEEGGEAGANAGEAPGGEGGPVQCGGWRGWPHARSWGVSLWPCLRLSVLFAGCFIVGWRSISNNELTLSFTAQFLSMFSNV